MDVKRRNRANTLRCILSCERISQMELTQRLALSWPTILQNVKELLEMGLVQETGQYESTGGRKAKAYAPVRDAKLAIGLDLTRNHVSVVLVDLSGQVVRYQRKSRAFSLDDAYLQELGTLIRSVMDSSCTDETILGVGVSLPGIVDSEANLLRYSHILDLRDIPLHTLSRYIPYPCSFINDANAAGLAEVYGTSAAGNLIYLSLSNSVGGAILTDGSLYMGNHLRAGEFGHNTLVPGGRQCYCGKEGCLDAYCSAHLLSEQADGNLAAFFDGLRESDRGRLCGSVPGRIWRAIAVTAGGAEHLPAGSLLSQILPLPAGSLCCGRGVDAGGTIFAGIMTKKRDGASRPVFQHNTVDMFWNFGTILNGAPVFGKVR